MTEWIHKIEVTLFWDENWGIKKGKIDMNNNDLGIAAGIIVMAIVLSVILLFLVIGVLVVIHVCIVGRSIGRGGSDNNPGIERGGPGNTGLSQDDIEKLPCFDFIAKSKGSSPVDCAVCLDNFNVGEKCRSLPLCKHSFHAECVDAWLLKMPVCPICRTSADSRRAAVVEGQESSHFSDVSVDLRGSLTTTESSRFSDDDVNTSESRDGQGTENSHLVISMPDIAIESRQGQEESTEVSNAGSESIRNERT